MCTAAALQDAPTSRGPNDAIMCSELAVLAALHRKWGDAARRDASHRDNQEQSLREREARAAAHQQRKEEVALR